MSLAGCTGLGLSLTPGECTVRGCIAPGADNNFSEHARSVGFIACVPDSQRKMVD